MPRHRAVVDEGDKESDVPDQLISAIRYGMTSTKKLCEDILPLCDPDLRKKMEETLTERFKQLIKAEMVYEEGSRIVNAVVDDIQIGETSNILEACHRIHEHSKSRVEQYQAEISDEQIESNPLYVSFTETVESTLEGGSDSDDGAGRTAFDIQPEEMETETEDNDVDEEGDVVPVIDPITKKDLKDPVRNKFCNHVYGKKAIVDLMKKNPQIKCPTVGCSNRKLLRENHLVHDEKLEEEVRKAQGKKKRGRR